MCELNVRLPPAGRRRRDVSAAAIRALIGYEWEHEGKLAGIRPHGMVSLGASLFTVVSLYGFGSAGDPARDTVHVCGRRDPRILLANELEGEELRTNVARVNSLALDFPTRTIAVKARIAEAMVLRGLGPVFLR